MPDLPQELIDRFVDDHSESTEDLKNLSLVGRCWLHRARYHLFRLITLAPQDPKEIREYYAYLRRRVSIPARGGRNHYHALTSSEQRLLHSSLTQNPQPQKQFLSSLSDTLPYVRGLRLESSIRIGGGRKIPPMEYFHRWLGYGNEYAEESLLMRDLVSYDDNFLEKQNERWEAVDLPWGHRAGLHGLPFRNLRYLHIQWSAFGWISSLPVAEDIDGDLPDSVNPDMWPGYQLGKLLKSSADTLNHVSIDEYPGFQLEQYGTPTHNTDALLDILAENAPNLKSLSLGGLMVPRRMSPHSMHDHYIDSPDPVPFFSRDRPAYRTGEEVPPVYSDPIYNDGTTPRHAIRLSLERLYLRGFDSKSTLLIEDVLLNRGILSSNTEYLALSAMPEDFDYMFLFSRLRQSITHLTLDLDNSTCNLKLKFTTFPKLRYLQVIIDINADADLEDIIYSLYDSAFPMDAGYHRTIPLLSLFPHRYEVQPPLSVHKLKTSSQQFRLHIEFGHKLQQHIPPSVDYCLKILTVTAVITDIPPTGHAESCKSSALKRTRVNFIDLVTVDLPATELEKAFPLTFQTGHLMTGSTDEWWRPPV
ncbi:hypothetical protein F5876DRAFT_81330 [Lentinula aff. lateritia]|uniref:Uncharacterized protein n=1 Tax=Lentinula aff. lateritia TaxID=2804960 RepID=A0ACC1TMK4_9AGAR|nr:hypothetical protein F5876DRAFT_81330 [Lentinula aff. lateritia]